MGSVSSKAENVAVSVLDCCGTNPCCAIPITSLVMAIAMAVLFFGCAVEFWIPGSVLISISKDDPNKPEHIAGFVLMMIAAGFAGCGFIWGCIWGCFFAIDRSST